MFREEAKWIRSALADLPLRGGTAVNLGASTAEFRQIVQPHIYMEVVKPLEKKGVRITHVDIKLGEGVNLVADLTASNFPQQLEQQYDLVLCTNMLEHVADISSVVQNLVEVAASDGYILLTVPRRYPLHFDPIDNGFRPTPDELAALVLEKTSGCILKDVVISIKEPSYYPVRQSRFPLWGYRIRLKYWVGMYYQVTGVLIQKKG